MPLAVVCVYRRLVGVCAEFLKSKKVRSIFFGAFALSRQKENPRITEQEDQWQPNVASQVRKKFKIEKLTKQAFK